MCACGTGTSNRGGAQTSSRSEAWPAPACPPTTAAAIGREKQRWDQFMDCTPLPPKTGAHFSVRTASFELKFHFSYIRATAKVCVFNFDRHYTGFINSRSPCSQILYHLQPWISCIRHFEELNHLIVLTFWGCVRASPYWGAGKKEATVSFAK